MSECPKPGTVSKQPNNGFDGVALITRYWPMLLALALFTVMQSEMFDLWWKSWNKPYSYYSHGPLVPLIAVFMVWSLRKWIAKTKIAPSWWGLALIIPSIPIFIFGRWTGSGVLCGFTFQTFLIGAMMLFLGTQMTRLLLFPALFLMAMIPAPATVLDNATLKVQILSTTVATKMLSIGYDVSQAGSEIHSDGLPEPLIVGTPCSGFRLLIALLTFTAFFVYMVRDPAVKRLTESLKFWWLKIVFVLVGALIGFACGKMIGGTALQIMGALGGALLGYLSLGLNAKQLILILVAFPLSLFINSLRIAMIGLAGFWTGTAEAMHTFHDWSGYIGLVICFVILFGFARLIKADRFGIPDPDEDYGDPARAQAPAYKFIGRGGRGMAVIILFALVITLNALIPPLEATAKGKIDRAKLPSSFGTWSSEDIPIQQMVKDELKTADMVQRIYSDYGRDGRQVMVFIEAARDTDAFHDPHSCLPGGGTPITQDRMVTLEFEKPFKKSVDATVLQASGPYGPALVLYWYMSGNESCAKTSDVRKIMRVIQLKDLADLASNPAQRSDIKKRINERQWYWFRFSTDVWDESSDSDLETLKEFVYDFMANAENFGQ